MLHIEHLTVTYGQLVVLQELSLDLKAIAIHGIVGLNGSGKTTLLNTLYGTVKPQQGQVQWQGRPLSNQDIAFLETQNYFYPLISGQDYLSLFTIRHPEFDVTGWNSLFQLPLKKLVDTYSTGMKKKLALMGVLAMDKPIIILDEPFNGLDLESNQQLKQIILQLKAKGKMLIVTSHILETLTATCDEIHYLRDQHIAFSTPRDQFPHLESKLFQLTNQETQTKIQSLLK